MNKKMLLNTNGEKIEKINKNELIEIIGELHIGHFSMCYTNDLNKMDMDGIDDLFYTIKHIKKIISKFDYYDTFYYYSDKNGECVLLSMNGDNFVIYDFYDDEMYNINEFEFDFCNEITLHEYIINKLNEQIKINEIKNTIIEN